jgi:hypothetical protein
MPYGLKTFKTDELIDLVTAAGGSFITDPKSFQLGAGKNVGKVLLFCHQAPETDKKLVVVVDNREDLKKEIELGTKFVMVVRSYAQFIQNLMIMPEPERMPEEKEILYYI